MWKGVLGVGNDVRHFMVSEENHSGYALGLQCLFSPL